MSIKLAILGLLMESDSHPYELKQRMKEGSMSFYMKIQEGSLYYAIDQLRKDGHIEICEVQKGCNRPDKTIYRITDSGVELLKRSIVKEMEKPSSISKPICGVLTFSEYADAEQFQEKLKTHLIQTEQRLDHLKQLYNDALPTAPLSQLYVYRSSYEHCLIELNWIREVYEQAVAGHLGDKGNPYQWEPIP